MLVAGFLVLSLSSFEMNAGMGRLTAITIVMALVTDFLLLPALLVRLDGGKEPASQRLETSPVSAGG